MQALSELERHEANIRNRGWFVRNYWRQPRERARAIHELGLAVRAAFNASDDFERLLVAVLDALEPRREERRF